MPGSSSLFFERPESLNSATGHRVLLVHVEFTARRPGRADAVAVDPDLLIAEFEHLVASAGHEQAALVCAQRREPQPRTCIGAGKVEEIQDLLRLNEDIGLVLFDYELTPAQGRNLERLLDCRVQTRTELILDVFAGRARTHEGKLQVQLAQLDHTATRLVRGWTHLDRQKGGVGMRGAGETQLEMDQRMLGDRTRKIRQRLERVRVRRRQNRRRRRRNEVATVVLVGYTNAGKSSLFNQLTSAGVLAADQLFATLDPTSRKVMVPGVGEVMLVDTVGFIRDLPHELVQAFRATLEEVAEADLLLHVMDVVAGDRDERCTQVLDVLRDIEADSVPTLTVLNKSDLLAGDAGGASDYPGETFGVSARTGAGVEPLFAGIARALRGRQMDHRLRLEPACGRTRAELYRHAAVVNEAVADDGAMEITVRMADADLHRYLSEDGVELLETLVPAGSGPASRRSSQQSSQQWSEAVVGDHGD